MPTFSAQLGVTSPGSLMLGDGAPVTPALFSVVWAAYDDGAVRGYSRSTGELLYVLPHTGVPGYLVVDDLGRLYVGGVNTLRRWLPNGVADTTSGGDPWIITLTGVGSIRGLALDPAYNVYVATTGTLRVYDEDAVLDWEDAVDIATTIVVSPDGYLYLINDEVELAVEKRTPANELVWKRGYTNPRRLALDPDGNLYLSTNDEKLYKLSPTTGLAQAGWPITVPFGGTTVACDAAGRVYLASTHSSLGSLIIVRGSDGTVLYSDIDETSPIVYRASVSPARDGSEYFVTGNVTPYTGTNLGDNGYTAAFNDGFSSEWTSDTLANDAGLSVACEPDVGVFLPDPSIVGGVTGTALLGGSLPNSGDIVTIDGGISRSVLIGGAVRATTEVSGSVVATAAVSGDAIPSGSVDPRLFATATLGGAFKQALEMVKGITVRPRVGGKFRVSDRFTTTPESRRTRLGHRPAMPVLVFAIDTLSETDVLAAFRPQDTGTWTSGSSYAVNHVVTFTDGKRYLCVRPHAADSRNKPPLKPYWRAIPDTFAWSFLVSDTRFDISTDFRNAQAATSAIGTYVLVKGGSAYYTFRQPFDMEVVWYVRADSAGRIADNGFLRYERGVWQAYASMPERQLLSQSVFDTLDKDRIYLYVARLFGAIYSQTSLDNLDLLSLSDAGVVPSRYLQALARQFGAYVRETDDRSVSRRRVRNAIALNKAKGLEAGIRAALRDMGYNGYVREVWIDPEHPDNWSNPENAPASIQANIASRGLTGQIREQSGQKGQAAVLRPHGWSNYNPETAATPRFYPSSRVSVHINRFSGASVDTAVTSTSAAALREQLARELRLLALPAHTDIRYLFTDIPVGSERAGLSDTLTVSQVSSVKRYIFGKVVARARFGGSMPVVVAPPVVITGGITVEANLGGQYPVGPSVTGGVSVSVSVGGDIVETDA